MAKLLSILLISGVVVLLAVGWAAQSETVYYLFYHLKDLTGDVFGLWSTPKGTKLINDSPFPPRVIVQIVVSVLLAALSLFVIRSERYGPTSRHWAYGAVGVLLGFWLKA